MVAGLSVEIHRANFFYSPVLLNMVHDQTHSYGGFQ